MFWKDFFSGKRITFMGLGLLGRGIGDVTFLAGCGAELLVTDRKSAEELSGSLAQLAQYKDISYILGEHRLEDFKNCDMVIKAAGVPLDSPYIAEARKNGIPVYMTTALFAKFAREAGATVVGITGTRGKSTTTHLIYHVLKNLGRRVHLGGNVRGLSTLALIPEVQAGDVAVLELDSWQLQGFGDLKLSPGIAVFTNLMPDHLNYYPTMEQYFEDKANVFKNQKDGDTLFVRDEVRSLVEGARPPVTPVVPPALPKEWKLRLRGEHNRENAALAAAALRALGVAEEKIRAGLESFESVEGRLQLLTEKNGCAVYNDNNATTPDATVAALKSFDKKVVLIAGGADKGLDTAPLLRAMAEHSKKVLLLEGTGTDRIKNELPNTTIYCSVIDAVKDALDAAAPGDVVLFSPGFASFGLFKNEYDRNDQFIRAVQAYIK